MKKIAIIAILFNLMLLNYLFGQGFCSTKSPKSSSTSTTTLKVAAQPCQLFYIRVYIHRINSNTGNGYSATIDNTIISTLNNSLNSYGFFFILSGSRTWYDDTFANPNTDPLVLQNIVSSSGNNFQNNAINIYVLPANSQISGGFVPNSNKQMLLIGGTRTVSHCQSPPSSVQYIIATTKVVSHEMGHCFGLIHTFETNGDDGLTDTPIDYVNNTVGGQGCINISNCQFTGTCSTCSLSSNPTTNMINFMSYSTPTCMSYFSPQQLDIMRYSLNNTLTSVVSQTQLGGPNLQSMTRDGSIFVNTVNSIPSGYHTVTSNVDPNSLINNMNWTPNTSSVYWGVSDTKNINAWLQPIAGQSVMFNITASNICGSSTRNVTFTVQSAFKIYSSTSITDQMTIEFDNISHLESLPQTISIF